MRAFLLGLLTLLLAACAPRPVIDPVYFPRFGDHDPVAWTGRAPHTYAVHGLDVSRFQEPIDWAQARAAGIQFAFVKATEGGDMLDPMYHDHRRGARAAGIRTGAYHFFYFCRPAVEQARWFIRNIPRNRRDLPHVLDLEWNPHSPTCTLRPDGAVIRREARIFLGMLERYYGRRPIIYTTPDFYEQTGIGQLTETEFWLRSVADHPGVVYPDQPWTLWQYTGTGIVPGAAGGIDINVFHGSPEAWRTWGR